MGQDDTNRQVKDVRGGNVMNGKLKRRYLLLSTVSLLLLILDYAKAEAMSFESANVVSHSRLEVMFIWMNRCPATWHMSQDAACDGLVYSVNYNGQNAGTQGYTLPLFEDQTDQTLTK